MVALEIPLDRTCESRELVYDSSQTLMSDNIPVPLVEVLDHPRVGVRPTSVIAANVHVDDPLIRKTRSYLGHREKEHLLGVDPVATLTATPWRYVARVEWQHLCVELDEIPLKIEGSIQPPQLPVEEVSHLVARSIRQIIDSEIFRRGKLSRHLVLVMRDVKEHAVGRGPSPHHTKEGGQTHRDGVDDSIDDGHVSVAIGHALDRKGHRELKVQDGTDQRSQAHQRLERIHQADVTSAEMEPSLV
jgi:hypothetical protein